MTIATTLWLLAIAALLGVVLLVHGWRGRRTDDHPLCRKCGYDLVASANAANCPECGRDLKRRRATRIGHRRVRGLMLSIGLLTLLATLAGGGAWGWARAKDVDWTVHKPLWLLRSEARSANAATAAKAVGEIEARFSDGRLSQGQINAIADEAIAAQLDSSTKWHDWWGEFIEQAATSNRLDRERIKRYIINAVKPNITLQTTRQVERGGMVSVDLVLAPFRAGKYPNVFSAEVARLRTVIGDLETDSSVTSILAIDSSGQGRIARTSRVALPPGRYRVEIEVRIRAGYALDLAQAVRTDDGTLQGGWEIAEERYTLAAEFDVVDSNSNASPAK